MEQGARPGRSLLDIHESWLPTHHPMHRPRHSERQRSALVCATVFLLAPALAFVLGVRPAEIENRKLRGLTDDGWGWSLLTGLDAWATDHLPLRRSAVQAQDAVSRSVFGEPGPIGQQRPPVGAGPVAVPPPAGAPPPVVSFPPVIEGADDWLYLGQDVVAKCVPSRPLDDSIAALRRMREAVEASGRRFVLTVAPDKTTMAPERLPDEYAGEECAATATDTFWQRVPAETGAIDLRPALAEVARDRGPIYDALDTHWTYEGGIVLTYSVANAIDPSASRSWQIAPTERRTWPADLPLLLGRDGERSLQGYSLSLGGGPDRTNFEASDFRTPTTYESTPARGTIDDRTVMVADSFTQFASPYLAATFTSLTIVHPETVGAVEQDVTGLFADADVVVVELAERSIAGGLSPLLSDASVDRLARALAASPR